MVIVKKITAKHILFFPSSQYTLFIETSIFLLNIRYSFLKIVLRKYPCQVNENHS